LIVHARPNELVFIDALTLQRLDGFALNLRSFCVLPGGTVAAFIEPKDGLCELEMIDPQRSLRTYNVPQCLYKSGERLVPGASATELYSLVGRVSRVADEFAVYRLAAGAVTMIGTVKLEKHASWELDQMLSLGDGRVVMRDGRKKLQIYEYAKPTTSHAIDRDNVHHLARGAGTRIWYSTTTDDDRKVQEIVLVPLGSTVADARMSVAPGRVTHMASGETGGLAAVIEVIEDARRQWDLLMLDEAGKQKWRIRVDAEITAKVKEDLNIAFVAPTTHRVVVSAGTHGMFAWDAATGARVG
jgi:hypothetical protein